MEAEAGFRALVRDYALMPPDRVDYAPGSVIFLWDGPRLAVVVDLKPDRVVGDCSDRH